MSKYTCSFISDRKAYYMVDYVIAEAYKEISEFFSLQLCREHLYVDPSWLIFSARDDRILKKDLAATTSEVMIRRFHLRPRTLYSMMSYFPHHVSASYSEVPGFKASERKIVRQFFYNVSESPFTNFEVLRKIWGIVVK